MKYSKLSSKKSFRNKFDRPQKNNNKTTIVTHKVEVIPTEVIMKERSSAYTFMNFG